MSETIIHAYEIELDEKRKQLLGLQGEVARLEAFLGISQPKEVEATKAPVKVKKAVAKKQVAKKKVAEEEFVKPKPKKKVQVTKPTQEDIKEEADEQLEDAKSPSFGQFPVPVSPPKFNQKDIK